MTMFENSKNDNSTTEGKRIISDNCILSSRISNFVFSYYMVSFVLYAIITLNSPGENRNVGDPKGRQFFLKMEFPFDAKVSPNYEIILVIQFLFDPFFVCGAAMSVVLVSTLVSTFF